MCYRLLRKHNIIKYIRHTYFTDDKATRNATYNTKSVKFLVSFYVQARAGTHIMLQYGLSVIDRLIRKSRFLLLLSLETPISYVTRIKSET